MSTPLAIPLRHNVKHHQLLRPFPCSSKIIDQLDDWKKAHRTYPLRCHLMSLKMDTFSGAHCNSEPVNQNAKPGFPKHKKTRQNDKQREGWFDLSSTFGSILSLERTFQVLPGKCHFFSLKVGKMASHKTSPFSRES